MNFCECTNTPAEFCEILSLVDMWFIMFLNLILRFSAVLEMISDTTLQIFAPPHIYIWIRWMACFIPLFFLLPFPSTLERLFKFCLPCIIRTSLVAQMVKCLPIMWDTGVLSLGWEDPLEKEMATHSSTLAWKIPWMEERARLHTVHGVTKSWTQLSNFTSLKYFKSYYSPGLFLILKLVHNLIFFCWSLTYLTTLHIFSDHKISGRRICLPVQETQFNSCVRKIPWRRKW